MEETTVQRRRRPKALGERRIQEAYPSRALNRALDVLESFPDEHTALSLRELSSRHNLPESSLFRILQTLEVRGYLTQAADGTYRLTPRVLYGKARERAERLRHLAQPHLKQLAMRFNETASIACLFEDRIEVLDSIETFHSMRLTNRPGRVLPPHCSSMGKCITAFQPPDRIDRLLEVYGLIKRGPNTIVDRQALLEEYERIREHGYAFDREEAAEGGFCVGAPIRCAGQPVVSAISISMPLLRYVPENEAALVAAVCETAHAIAVSVAPE
jgi:DNA-binding IclR family transcriptional regulator